MNQEALKKVISEFLKETGIHTGEISFSLSDDGLTLWASISTPLSGLLLAREGDGLHALNYLVRKAAEKSLGEEIHTEEKPRWNIIIDVNNYQKKRVDAVKSVAHMLAERARYFKSNIECDPMSAFERRVIHEFLATATDLKTESAGIGPKRHVVIKYTGNI